MPQSDQRPDQRRDQRRDRSVVHPDVHPLDAAGCALPDGSWPDARPAPDGLELVRRFCNTVNHESGGERWRDPAGFDVWLVAEGRPPAGASPEVLAGMIGLREAIRGFVEAGSHEVGADGTGIDAVSAAVGPLTVHLADAGGQPALRADAADPAGGGPVVVEQLVADLALALVVGSATGSLARLKACRNDHCRWVFYDRSKNRGGRWCSMTACGGRAKARRYRRRHAAVADRPTVE